jgi:multimeric flavodoxin WrbA
MPKKIVFIQGSPRKNGNTCAMAEVAATAAKKLGAAVAEIDISALQFKTPGCTGCQQCQLSEKFECVIKDELTRVVATLPDYDVLVFSTPLYWWSSSAQIKMLIDRMYSLVKFNEAGEIKTPLAGKKLALLATAFGPLENNLDLLERQLKFPSEMLNCTFAACLFHSVTQEAGKLKEEKTAYDKAEEFGRQLAS